MPLLLLLLLLLSAALQVDVVVHLNSGCKWKGPIDSPDMLPMMKDRGMTKAQLQAFANQCKQRINDEQVSRTDARFVAAVIHFLHACCWLCCWRAFIQCSSIRPCAGAV